MRIKIIIVACPITYEQYGVELTVSTSSNDRADINMKDYNDDVKCSCYMNEVT